MRTFKQPGPVYPATDFRDTILDAHAQIAIEQSAIFSTEIAISRWTSSKVKGVLNAATAPPVCEPARARWYAQEQQNFQEWLARGGFSQPDDATAEPAMLRTFTLIGDSAQRDADEQSVDAFVN